MITFAYWLTMFAMAVPIVAIRRALVRELRRVRAFRPRHDLRMRSRLPHWDGAQNDGRDRVERISKPPARPSAQHRAEPASWPTRLARTPSILVESGPWRQGTGRRVALASASGSSWFWQAVYP